MATAKKFLLKQIGGGMNQGADPTAIGDNEWEDIQNMYPWQGRMIRRRGLNKITSVGTWDELISSMFDYKTAAGAWTLIVGGETKLGKLSGNQVIDISKIGGTPYLSRTDPWVFAQYQDVFYACRKDGGSLQRSNGLSVGDAGISAPATGATLAQGAAGSLGAGDYIGVVTFGNSLTGAESDPSPVSNTLTLGASKKIDWTSIPTSTNAQTDVRYLYRTLAGQTGEYYWVGTLEDNFTTTFTDNVIQDNMGAQASFDNGLPPASVVQMAVWNERLWLSDQINLYFSELGLVESYSTYSVIPVTPDDGHTINGLLPFGSSLLTGKSNAMHYVVGTDESDFEVRVLSDRHGCNSHHSMQTGEGMAIWFGGNNFYQTDGNVVRSIGDTHVRDIVDGIDSQYYNLVRGALDPKRKWYIAGVPADGATEITKLLIFNYEDQTWTTCSYTNKTPQFLGDFFDENGAHVFYCSAGDEGSGDSHIYQWDNSNTDADSDAIPVECLSKKYGFETDDILKFMKDIALHTNKIAEDITVSLYADGVLVAGPTTLNMWSIHEWKRVPLSNRGRLGAYLQLKIEYTGTRELELKGMQFKIVETNRRAKHL
jgi:hypothetical protein